MLNENFHEVNKVNILSKDGPPTNDLTTTLLSDSSQANDNGPRALNQEGKQDDVGSEDFNMSEQQRQDIDMRLSHYPEGQQPKAIVQANKEDLKSAEFRLMNLDNILKVHLIIALIYTVALFASIVIIVWKRDRDTTLYYYGAINVILNLYNIFWHIAKYNTDLRRLGYKKAEKFMVTFCSWTIDRNYLIATTISLLFSVLFKFAFYF